MNVSMFAVNLGMPCLMTLPQFQDFFIPRQYDAAIDGLCFLVAYQLNSLFIFMMLFLFNVQLRNKYDDDDDDEYYTNIDCGKGQWQDLLPLQSGAYHILRSAENTRKIFVFLEDPEARGKFVSALPVCLSVCLSVCL